MPKRKVPRFRFRINNRSNHTPVGAYTPNLAELSPKQINKITSETNFCRLLFPSQSIRNIVPFVFYCSGLHSFYFAQ